MEVNVYLKLYYKDKYVKLIQGDCLEAMDKIIEKNIKFNAIITDIPYGTTVCKWDTVIPFDKMWERLDKLIYDSTPVLLFGCEPFSSNLRLSNIKNYKYDWYWHKNRPTGGATSDKQPMKCFETISVFYKNQCYYNPQMTKRSEEELKKLSKNSLTKCDSELYGLDGYTQIRENLKEKYPTNYINIKTVFSRSSEKVAHPTQKPIELMEYFINTYTNENDLILDFTCGSGTTLVAAKKLHRKCIGIELEEKYCEIAKNRLLNIVDNAS
jgi:site-specific DNA-methyltransferase (adenine-specific)